MHYTMYEYAEVYKRDTHAPTIYCIVTLQKVYELQWTLYSRREATPH